MRGLEAFNFEAFDEAAAQIASMGHTPISPAELSRRLVRECGFDPEDESSYKKVPLETFMEEDIRAMRYADCVVLLPGWEESEGSQVEVAYARFRHIPIYELADMHVLHHLKDSL